MDARDETPRTGTSKKGNTSGKKSNRRTVRNRASDPFGDDDIPPFDNEPTEPISDSVFEGVGSSDAPDNTSGDTPPRRPRAPKSGTRTTRSTASCGKRSAPGRTSGGAGKNTKQTPAETVYRIRPYVVLVLGVFLAVSMLAACFSSGFRFDLTRDSHPFRWVGYYLEYFVFGLFGYGAFLLPPMMIGLSICRIRTPHSRKIAVKTGVCAAILVIFPAVIHTCMIGAGSAGGVLNTYDPRVLYPQGAEKIGGGVFGGLLGRLCYVGLGTTGTLVIGILALLLLGLLVFGITPATVWNSLRAWCREQRERRAERETEEEAAQSASRARPTRDVVPVGDTASGRTGRSGRTARAAKDAYETENDREETTGAADGSTRLSRDARRHRRDACREAERSDRLEEKAEAAGGRSRLDPMRALLEQDNAGETKKEGDEGETLRRRTAASPSEPSPSDVFPGAEERFGVTEVTEPDDTPHIAAQGQPLEAVRELSPEDVFAMEQAYASHRAAPVAKTEPAETEPEMEETAEAVVTYPAHAEIEVADDYDDTMEPTADPSAACGAGAGGGVTFSKETDYQGGFDYSMAADDGSDAEGGSVTSVVGGVDVCVETLSTQERERGNIIAAPQEEQEDKHAYVYPRVDLLAEVVPAGEAADREIREKMEQLRDTLINFKINIANISYVCGPTVTRYEVKPAPGVRVRSIASLSDDIAMNLAASEVRIEAPIPGKMAVGIEVPNDTRTKVYLRGLIDSDDFRTRKSKLTACLGQDVAGNPIFLDIVKMPHLLVAGTTGSGKSVCINSIIMSLLYKSTPDEVKLILVDPKTVEFSIYKDIPHLMAPILCEPKRAAAALNLAVLEMEKRFEQIREVGVRDIAGYNAITANDRYEHPYMPQLVIIIDELADLMMTAKDEVETSICRLAQKARAAGIHLIIGTQRPSVDVITGLIKANIPSRIAFTVMSQVDSRTILDIAGAEKLIGYGDMLYMPIGSPKPLRVQGTFVSDSEVERIVDFVRRNNDPVRYDQAFLDNLDREAQMIGNKQRTRDEDDGGDADPNGLDPKFYEALRVAIDNGRISTSLLQRMLSIGYGRAAKLIDQMERMHYVGPAVGNKPREILITDQMYAELMVNRDVE